MTAKRLRHRCNSSAAVSRALLDGFDGAEFDVVWNTLRQGGNALVVSHEHGSYGEDLGEFLLNINSNVFLAINVKEYGMAPELQKHLKNRGNYFVFDVPGPELYEYEKYDLRVFGRFSEREIQKADDYLLDSFDSSNSFINECYDYIVELDGKQPAALISPTLRGLPQWSDELIRKFRYLITK